MDPFIAAVCNTSEAAEIPLAKDLAQSKSNAHEVLSNLQSLEKTAKSQNTKQLKLECAGKLVGNLTRLRLITLQEFKDKDTEVERSRTLVEKSNARANQAVAQLGTAQEEYGQLKTAYHDVKAQASKFETQVTELRSEVAEIPDLRHNIESLEDEMGRLSSKKDELDSALLEIDNLRAELAQRRSEANALTSAQQEIAKLREEVSRLQAASPGDHLAHTKVVELQDENAKLRSALAKEGETREEQAKLINSFSQERGELREQISKLQAVVTSDANKQLLESSGDKAQRSDHELGNLKAGHATRPHEYVADSTALRSPVPSPVVTGPVPSSISLPPDTGGRPSIPVASSRPPDFSSSHAAQSLTSLRGPGLSSGQHGYVDSPDLPPRSHPSTVPGTAGQPSYPDHRGGQPTQYSGPHQGGYTLPINRGPRRPRILTGDEVRRVAKHMQRFEPRPGGTIDTQAYLEDIDAHLDEYGFVATESKLKLITCTASRDVTNFIRRQTDNARGHWPTIRQAIIEEFTDHQTITGITSAMDIKQYRDESVHAYYTRLRRAFFGECNIPEMEENVSFKSLFVHNLQSSIRRQLPLDLEPAEKRATELKALARKAFERERPNNRGEREVFDLQLKGGYTQRARQDGQDQYRRGDHPVPSWNRDRSASYNHSRPPSRDDRHRGPPRDRSQSPFRKSRSVDGETDELAPKDPTVDRPHLSLSMDILAKLVAKAWKSESAPKAEEPSQATSSMPDSPPPYDSSQMAWGKRG